MRTETETERRTKNSTDLFSGTCVSAVFIQSDIAFRNVLFVKAYKWGAGKGGGRQTNKQNKRARCIKDVKSIFSNYSQKTPANKVPQRNNLGVFFNNKFKSVML